MCAGIEGYTGDTAAALQMISDNNFFMEVKKNYGASMVTGFIRLNGSTVGCVANRSEVYENGEKVQTLEAALCGKGYLRRQLISSISVMHSAFLF